MIDYQPDLINRLGRGRSSPKLELEHLIHLSGNTITAGDVVSHAISTSTLKSILLVLGDLVDNFKQEIETISERWLRCELEETPPVVHNYPKVCEDIEKVLTKWHISVHEAANDLSLTHEDVLQYCNSVKNFSDALSWLFVKKKYGFVPETQFEITQSAGAILKERKAALSTTLDNAYKIDSIDTEKLQESQDLWQRLHEIDAELYADPHSGGSIHPTVLAGALSSSIDNRIKQLERLIGSHATD